MCIASIMQTWYLCLFHTQVYCIVCIFPHVTQKCVDNVKSKFDYIDENKQKSEIANNDKFEKRN
jgi:hypothetical protein